MSSIDRPACALQSRGHVLNFIQLKLGVGRWRREGVFTAGHVLDVDDDGVRLGTDDGVIHLHHHWPHAVEVALERYGSETVLLDHGVLVLLGARQEVVFDGSATFSVATVEQRVDCRTDRRPGDNTGTPLL
jgi:hypothetical protein